MKFLVILLTFASAFLLQACGRFLPLYEDCKITDVSADARLDEDSNQVHVYEFRFQPGFGMCGGAHVNGSYNVGTQEAQEKIERGDLTFTSSFQCDIDPWISPPPPCARNSMLFSQTGGEYNQSEFSQADIDDFETADRPLSVYALGPARDTLKEQLGNALRKFPAPIVKPAADITDPNEVGVVTKPVSDSVRITVPDTVGVVTKPVSDSVRITVPAPLPIVQKGDDGQLVEALQYLLRQAGEKGIVVDGDFGDHTVGAVRDFQKRNNLAQDGKVGPQTWAKLWVTVRKGASQKDAVSAAQVLLNWQGTNVNIDGDFGDQTDAAVRAFQRSEKLAEDGIVGPATWSALATK